MTKDNQTNYIRYFEWSLKIIKNFSTLVLFLWMQFYFKKSRIYSGKYELQY